MPHSIAVSVHVTKLTHDLGTRFRLFVKGNSAENLGIVLSVNENLLNLNIFCVLIFSVNAGSHLFAPVFRLFLERQHRVYSPHDHHHPVDGVDSTL